MHAAQEEPFVTEMALSFFVWHHRSMRTKHVVTERSVSPARHTLSLGPHIAGVHQKRSVGSELFDRQLPHYRSSSGKKHRRQRNCTF